MIAQQDWIIAKAGNFNRDFDKDAAIYARLAECYERGTIREVVVQGHIYQYGVHFLVDSIVGKIEQAVGSNAKGIDVAGKPFTIAYPSETYNTLVVIQLAQDGIKGSALEALPTFGKTSNLLWATNSGAQAVIASEDGFAYNVTASGRKITGISKSTTTAEAAKTALSLSNVIVLSEEDAANLVGYSITDND